MESSWIQVLSGFGLQLHGNADPVVGIPDTCVKGLSSSPNPPSNSAQLQSLKMSLSFSKCFKLVFNAF